jgi:hypothetical protein
MFIGRLVTRKFILEEFVHVTLGLSVATYTASNFVRISFLVLGIQSACVKWIEFSNSPSLFTFPGST